MYYVVHNLTAATRTSSEKDYFVWYHNQIIVYVQNSSRLLGCMFSLAPAVQ